MQERAACLLRPVQGVCKDRVAVQTTATLAVCLSPSQSLRHGVWTVLLRLSIARLGPARAYFLLPVPTMRIYVRQLASSWALELKSDKSPDGSVQVLSTPVTVRCCAAHIRCGCEVAERSRAREHRVRHV